MLMDLPLDVDGRPTTVGAAVADNVRIQELLREAIQQKLAGLDNNMAGAGPDPARNPADLANMLRDALSARMRARGI